MAKKENWVWMPHPGHFIASRSCRFKLNTYVGGYIVSTVGEYYPRGNEDKPETIGMDRLYETMVFKAIRDKGADTEWKCCPWTATDFGNSLDFDAYNTATDAYKGHLKLCRKWATK